MKAIASNTVLVRAMNYFTENGLVAFDLHRKTDFYQAIDFVNAKSPIKVPLSENQAFLFHSMPVTPNMVVFDTLKNKFYLVIVKKRNESLNEEEKQTISGLIKEFEIKLIKIID